MNRYRRQILKSLAAGVVFLASFLACAAASNIPGVTLDWEFTVSASGMHDRFIAIGADSSWVSEGKDIYDARQPPPPPRDNIEFYTEHNGTKWTLDTRYFNPGEPTDITWDCHLTANTFNPIDDRYSITTPHSVMDLLPSGYIPYIEISGDADEPMAFNLRDPANEVITRYMIPPSRGETFARVKIGAVDIYSAIHKLYPGTEHLDLRHLASLFRDWGKQGLCEADINKDSIVNLQDYAELAGLYPYKLNFIDFAIHASELYSQRGEYRGLALYTEKWLQPIERRLYDE